VVTFDKNPAAVVNPASAPPRLTDIDQKLELLAETGVDRILVIEFDAERAREKAEDFVAEVLVAELSARVVVVGDDFHFGNKRLGNVALLQEMGEQAGFSVEPVHLVSDERAHEVVSSTRIRALIARGELSDATAFLGRAHEVRGVVVAGDRPGRDGRAGLVIEVPGEILLPPSGAVSYTHLDVYKRQAQAGTTEVAVVEVAVEIVAEPAETDDLLSPPGAEPDAAAEEGPVP